MLQSPPASDRGLVNDSVNTCRVTGVPSSKAPCPVSAKPAFDGQQAYYNSGWLKASEKFTVHLSSTTP